MTSHPRHHFPDPRASRSTRVRLHWLVLAAGVALTLALFWRDGLQTAENVRLAFAQEANQRMELINREVDEDLVSLDHLARFCDVADPMTRDKFQRFAAPLVAHRGVQLLAWVPRVTAEGRTDFETAARLEWSPEFQVCDRESNGELKRAEARAVYFPVLYLEPLKGNERTLGRDLGEEAAYATPMAQAQQTGAAAITARVELPVGNTNQTGFIVFVPVLPHLPPVETATADPRPPRGFVVGAFHLAEVVRAALETEIPRGLVIQIRDLGAPEADQLVFTGGSSRAMAAAARNEPLPHLTSLRAEQEFEFASRRWRITVFAQERFVREHGGQLNWGLLLAGFGGSGLLALYVHELRSARRRVETALLESELRFSTVFHASPLAVAISRFRDGLFLDANEAFVRLYGYSRDELIGHTQSELRLWSRPEERSKVMAQLREQRRVEAVEVSGRRKSGEGVHLLAALELVELEGETCVVGMLSDITPRQRMEVQLRLSEERWRFALEVLRVGVWERDLVSRAVVRSERHAAIFGCPGAASPWSLEQFFDSALPEDRARVEETVRRGDDEGVPVELKFRIRRADGQVRWVRVSSQSIINQHGHQARLGIIEDITESALAEADLREREFRYRLLAENVADVVWLYSLAEDRYIYVSPSVERRGGYTAEEFLRLPLLAALAPESRALVAAKMPGRVAGFAAGDESCRTQTEELQELRRDGTVVCAEVVTTLIADAERRVTHVQGVSRDITERKRMEATLRQFERVASTSSDLIALIGADFRYKLVNQAYLEARQLRLTDMVGREMREILGEERFEQEARPQVERCLRGEAFEVLEWNDFGGGRRFFHHVKLTPYREPDGTISGAVMTGRDITALKQAEDALRQAQKMEGIGHLAGGVAHHFNNILAAMTLNLGLLRERLRDPEADESVRLMLDLARDAGLLVGQLLAFGRKSMLQIKPCDLRQLVTGSCRLLSPLLGERIRLEFSTRGGSPWIEADRALIEQVLMNLCLNARDAMPEGGDLRIELDEMEVGVAAVRQHPEARPGAFARLTVSDSGHGMDAATLERLFEPFFTTKEVGRGTGLGLATAYGIVEQHKGWIEVESELGRGTTFRVWLPAVPPTESAPPRAAGSPAPAGARVVLLVEDDPAVRRAFAAYMRHHGYRVFTAADGPDARAVWSEQRGQIDLLFTDMVMPRGENGLQLALGLRAAKPELKVILSSGYSFDLVDFTSAETAQFVRLPKPFSPEELTAALARCFEPQPD